MDIPVYVFLLLGLLAALLVPAGVVVMVILIVRHQSKAARSLAKGHAQSQPGTADAWIPVSGTPATPPATGTPPPQVPQDPRRS